MSKPTRASGKPVVLGLLKIVQGLLVVAGGSFRNAEPVPEAWVLGIRLARVRRKAFPPLPNPSAGRLCWPRVDTSVTCAWPCEEIDAMKIRRNANEIVLVLASLMSMRSERGFDGRKLPLALAPAKQVERWTLSDPFGNRNDGTLRRAA